MWIAPLAIAAAAVLLIAFLPAWTGPLALIATTASVWAIAAALGPRLRRREAYDLEELRRVHEREELRSIQEDDVQAPEQVVCLRCMTQYEYRLGACPRCGLSR